MVAYNYPFKLILGPALMIPLAIALMLALKVPSLRKAIGAFLIVVGLVGAGLTTFTLFIEGFFIALATSTFGAFLFAFYRAKVSKVKFSSLRLMLWLSLISFLLIIVPLFLRLTSGFFVLAYLAIMGALTLGIVVASIANSKFTLQHMEKWHANLEKTWRLKRALYIFLIAVIIVSSLLISVRATGVVREEYLENFNYVGEPNLTIVGTINSVSYNHEVNTGYSYHIFPAYITLKMQSIVWSSNELSNQTFACDYLSQKKELTVYYEKTDVPSLTVGQQVQVCGYYRMWFEDSIYSDVLVVSPNVNGSYVNILL
ncbi:MAG: hypothetical protein NWE98_01490 [Candidatus Bathyarchaeota archaeon]|nr:hypothetical protein [Candidatus Bathyarchaeota archaeon]